MKKRVFSMGASLLIYCLVTLVANAVLVAPPGFFHLSSFLPPILGLVWGPMAALGVGLGEVLLHGSEAYRALMALSVGNLSGAYDAIALPSRHIFCAMLAAWLTCQLWHRVGAASARPFALQPKIILKFTVIIFVTSMAKTAFFGLSIPRDIAIRMLTAVQASSTDFFDYLFAQATTDFNLSLFFGLPLFFFMVAKGFPFYLPNRENHVGYRDVLQEHPTLMLLFHPFLLALFLLLDCSGIIYGMNRLDVWQMFNLEVLTFMNLIMVVFVCLLLQYRHSIMNDIMMLQILTVFLAAFTLGGICYVSMNRLTDERIAETLDIMSHLSRERLSSAMDGIRTAARSMRELAVRRLDSYDHFASSPEYRQEYIREMEQAFYPVAYYTDGCISFYLRIVKEIGGAKSGFYWVRPAGQWEGTHTPFRPRFVTDITQYAEKTLGWYYLPLRRHNPTWVEPYVDVNTNARVISYSLPLYVEGKPLGIIGMDVDFEYLTHEIRRMSVYGHGFAYLTDRTGHVLYHKDYPVGAMVPSNPELYTSETYLSSGIWLGIAVPAYEVYQDRNSMLIHLILGVLLLAMAISFLSIYLAMRGIRPLLALIIAVKKIAAGHLDITLGYDSRNELGVLAQSIREMTAKLEDYVHRDELTGLKNNAAYRRAVEKLMQRNKSGDIPYGVVLFDVNFLKQVNDKYGHEAGNEIIRCAASIISSTFAHSHSFRVGGDEFIVILEGHDYENRDELLDKFDAQAAQASFQAAGKELPVSVARGLAIHQPGQPYDELFQEADAAMYQNKASIKAQKNMLWNT